MGFYRGGFKFINLELKQVALIIKIFYCLIFFFKFSFQNRVLGFVVGDIGFGISVVRRISVWIWVGACLFV
jgi:hypothetical protein